MTELRRQSKELPGRDLEEIFRRIFVALPVGAYVVQKRKFLLFNPQFQKLLGHPADELLAMDCLDPVLPDDKGFVRDNAVKWLNGERLDPYEYRYVRKDRTIGWALETVMAGQYRGERAALGYFMDMTERRQAEAALRRTEEFSSNVLRSSPYPIAVIDPDSSVRYVNPALERLTGFSAADLVGMKTPYPWWTEERCRQTESDYERALRMGASKLEECFRKKSGEQFWVEITSTPVMRDGELQYYISNWVDITQRKLAEQTLRESEARFKDLADLLPQTVFEIDEQSNITFVNRFGLERFGYTQDDLAAGVSVLHVLLPEDRDRAEERIKRIMAGEELGPSEYVAHSKDGGEFPVLVYSNAVVRDNRPVGLRAIAIDITEQKRAETALKESEKRYRDIFDNSRDAIIIRDFEGKIIEANEAAAGLTGYTRDELAKMNIAEFLSAESLELTMERQRSLLGGQATPQRYELELVRKDGSRRAAESVAALTIQTGRAVGIQAMVRDITEQKRLRENMQFYISQITKAQEEERKRIARELHDETAQSLATLSLDVEAITRARDQLSEEAIWRLKQLRARIDDIMDGVRRFSHELRPGDLDEVGVVLALESLIEELNKDGRIRARVEVSGAERRLPPETELVMFRIAQEALRNVRKHSMATEAMVRIEFAKRKVMMNVTDNGCGFELPEVLGDFAGEGKLGLIGMYERARLLSGSFSLRSQVGRGTTVAVEVAG